MRKKFVQFVAAFLVLALLPTLSAGAIRYRDEIEEDQQKLLRVGLYYGTDTLPGANLQNYIGEGFRFGIMDGDEFLYLGETSENAISIVKTQNVFYSNSIPGGGYGYSDQITSDIVVGCYHLQLNERFRSFDEALSAARRVDGFPAWIDGEYVVRYGAYPDRDDALREAGNGWELVGTSSYGFTVVPTGGDTPIFQFDGASVGYSQFVVAPGLDESEKTATYFKGYKYYGYFRYERIGGGDISVVNIVGLEDYTNCVISREMNDSWPIEALKAQAVAVRSYALTCSGHSTFDVCYNEHCQAYYGMGSTGENTTRAAEETAGLYARYDGEIIRAFYCSSNGGATENCENVWVSELPYLQGVEDPYEALVASRIPSYNWTVTYTGQQLADRLNSIDSDYNCSKVVDVRILEFTPTGNVYSLLITDVRGKEIQLTKDKIRTELGLKSLHFSTGEQGDGYSLTGDRSVASLDRVYVLGENGTAKRIQAKSIFAITASGIEEVMSSRPTEKKDEFVFAGTGHGHNLGMSQWGANAMATEGYTYDEILKFYYTGIEIY